MRPEDLTHTMIGKIGEDYLKSYEGKWRHNNQVAAQKLSNHGHACYETWTPYENWKFLLDVYGSLEVSSGKLTSAMDKLFIDAFGLINIPKGKKILALPIGSPLVIACNGQMVADYLRTIVNEHKWTTAKNDNEAKTVFTNQPPSFFFERTQHSAVYNQPEWKEAEPESSNSLGL